MAYISASGVDANECNDRFGDRDDNECPIDLAELIVELATAINDIRRLGKGFDTPGAFSLRSRARILPARDRMRPTNFSSPTADITPRSLISSFGS